MTMQSQAAICIIHCTLHYTHTLSCHQKRHGAQSTRLHRQLQESQLRRRSWADEARRLRATIAQLQHKVEE